MISLAFSASARYSASVEDRDTVSRDLADQDTKFDPKNLQKPVVDHRVSKQPDQSSSQ